MRAMWFSPNRPPVPSDGLGERTSRGILCPKSRALSASRNLKLEDNGIAKSREYARELRDPYFERLPGIESLYPFTMFF